MIEKEQNLCISNKSSWMEIDFLTMMEWVRDRKLGVKIRVPLMISITTMELVQTWLVKIIANILIRQKALQYSLTMWQIKVCQIQTMDKSSLMESSSNCKMFQHVNVNKTQFSTWKLLRISDYLEKIEVLAKSQRRQYRDAEHSQNINNWIGLKSQYYGKEMAKKSMKNWRHFQIWWVRLQYKAMKSNA